MDSMNDSRGLSGAIGTNTIAGASVVATSPAFLLDVKSAAERVQLRKVVKAKRRSLGTRNAVQCAATPEKRNRDPSSTAHNALDEIDKNVPWEALSPEQANDTRRVLKETAQALSSLCKQVEDSRSDAQKVAAEKARATQHLQKLGEQGRGGGVPGAILKIAPWAPDNSREDCKICASRFTLLNRRHHCRSCGELTCGACSNHFEHLQNLGYADPQRMCNACFKEGKHKTQMPIDNKQGPPQVKDEDRRQQHQQDRTVRLDERGPLRSITNTPPRSGGKSLLVDIKNSQGKLRPTGKSCEPSPNLGTPPPREAGRPRTVLDELRSNLVKRSSSPDVLKARANIEEVVSSGIKEKKSQLAKQRVVSLQPKEGTAIAHLFAAAAAQANRGDKENEESWD